MQRQADAVIVTRICRKVVRADFSLRSPVPTMCGQLGAQLLALFFELDLVEARPQHAQGFGLFFDLRFSSWQETIRRWAGA